MDILKFYFELKGIKYLMLDGSTKSDDRGDRMAEFNSKETDINVFVLSTRAGG